MRLKGRKLFGLSVDMSAAGREAGVVEDPAPQARADGIHRVQVGLFGLAAMVLLVALAGVIGNQADLTDEAAVPDAAPTTEPWAMGPGPNPMTDPGVVPDIPAEPSPAPLLDPLVLPPPTSSPAINPSASPKP